MNEQSQNFAEQGAAFQRIWLESMSKLMHASFTFSPDSAPPELLREIRNGVLKALGESWNDYLRSPQFQESMKQCMDNAVAFRKQTNDFMAKVHKEMQTPSRDDIDTVMLAVHHMETRILDRLEEMANQVEALKQRNGEAQTAGPGGKTEVRQPTVRKAARRRVAKNGGQPAKS